MTTHIIGVDIAKLKFDCCLLSPTGKSHQVFTNDATGFKQLDIWLKKSKIAKLHVCMEATGCFWEELATHLQAVGHTVSVVNPARIKLYARSRLSRNKNDVVDAAMIALFCQSETPAAWQPPSQAQRQLRELARHVAARKEDLVREKNRLQNRILCCEVKADVKLAVKRLLATIRKLEHTIAELIKSNPQLAERTALLESIPGIGATTAATFLAELPDPVSFDNPSQAAAYAGLTPRQNESGSSLRGKARLCKTGNAKLRLALYFPAIVAMRLNPTLKVRAERLLAAGKSKMCVIGAIMHHLLRLAFAVLKSGKSFDPNYRQAKAK